MQFSEGFKPTIVARWRPRVLSGGRNRPAAATANRPNRARSQGKPPVDVIRPLALTLLDRLNVTPIQRFSTVLSATIIGMMGIGAGAQVVIGTPYPPYPAGTPDSSLRIQVTPQDTAVYVDGYYAGVVDDFDGMWQRLRVEPGQHEIALYHEGYRTAREHVYLVRDKTFTIKRQLEALPPGSAAEPRPTPEAASGGEGPRPLPRGARPDPPLRSGPAGALPRVPSGESVPNGTGRLMIRVQPSDADIRIDGQPLEATPGENSTALDISEGRHVVQVRKAGYVGYLTEIDVRTGETSNVEVTLRVQP